ncbi:hypothetical protein LguiA_013631 [Lonicera macranthoides]
MNGDFGLIVDRCVGEEAMRQRSLEARRTTIYITRRQGWDVLAKWLPNYGRIALSQTSSGIFIPLTAILLLALRDYSFQGICSWLALVRNGEHNVKRASYEQSEFWRSVFLAINQFQKDLQTRKRLTSTN